MLRIISRNRLKIFIVSSLTFLLTALELLYLDLLSSILDEEKETLLSNEITEISLNSAVYIVIALVCIRYIGMFYLQSIIVKFGSEESKGIKKIAIQRFLSKQRIFINEGEFIFELSELVHLYILQIFIPILRILCDGLIFLVLYIYFLYLYPVVALILVLWMIFYAIFYNIFILRKLRIYGLKANNAQSKYLEFVSSLYSGIDEIFIARKPLYFINKTVSLVQNYNKPYFKGYLIGVLPKILIEATILFTMLLLILFSLAGNGLSIDVSLIMIFLLLRIGSQLSNLFNMISNLRYGHDTIERIENLVVAVDDK